MCIYIDNDIFIVNVRYLLSELKWRIDDNIESLGYFNVFIWIVDKVI